MKHFVPYRIVLFFVLIVPGKLIFSQDFSMVETSVTEGELSTTGYNKGYPSEALANPDSLDLMVLERMGLVYQFNFFRQPWVRRWHVAGLRADLNVMETPVIGKINYGMLVGSDIEANLKSNLQFQLEAYPRLGPSDYLYMSAAYSPSRLFPQHYYGLEWYHNFRQGIEASAGARWLQWDESLWFYTGSVGKYLGNYWFSLRAYITPQEEMTGQTYSLSARRYLATSMDYLGVKLIYGTSPDQISYAIDFPQIRKLNSTGAYLTYQRVLKRWLVNFEMGYRREEYFKDDFRGHISTRLQLLYQFNN